MQNIYATLHLSPSKFSIPCKRRAAAICYLVPCRRIQYQLLHHLKILRCGITLFETLKWRKQGSRCLVFEMRCFGSTCHGNLRCGLNGLLRSLVCSCSLLVGVESAKSQGLFGHEMQCWQATTRHMCAIRRQPNGTSAPATNCHLSASLRHECGG